MRKILLFISLISIFSLVACSTNEKKSIDEKKTEKTVVYLDGELVSFDKNQLVNNADVIISGTVVSQEVQEDFKGLPVTDTFIKVEEIYKGEPGDTVEVRVDGGETDEMISIPDENLIPTFQIGEKVILFLTSNKGNRPDKSDFGYYVLGQYQGKFSLNDAVKIGVLKNDSNSFSFDNFKEEIKSIEEQNRKNKLPKIYLPEGQESDI